MSVFKRFKSWADKNICWCKAAAFVSVVVFGYKVVRYTILTILITFFTQYIDFNLVKAARYVNFKDAATVLFGIVVAYMSDALFSPFRIIASSILSTIAGLLLFFLNLILRRSYDSLYIIGMLLLAAGEAGFISLLNEFLAGQLRGHAQNTNTERDRVESSSEGREESPVEDLEEAPRADQEEARDEAQKEDQNTNTEGDRVESSSEHREEARKEDQEEAQEEARKKDQEETQKEDQAEDRVKARTRIWWIFAWVSSVIATFVIGNSSWEVIFGTLTLMLFVIFILFMIGSSFYHTKDFGGDGSNFIRVIKASLLNLHLNYPTSPAQFHENNGNQLRLSPQVKILRWLDKAAIIDPSSLKEDQELAGRLCTVTQVEESKHLLKMIPMWSTFFVVGLVSSTGDTFFSEQGKNLDSTDFTFYVVFFIKPISKVAISFFYKKLLNSNRGSKAQQKLGKIMRIWFGMVVSTIFCTVAWRVEVHRLQIVRRKIENPSKIIHNMNIFWLAPQYCLLGLMEGSSMDGLDEFMISELPNSLKYVSAMNGFVIDGIGSFLSILFMKANEKLFAETLNDSRLDKYYLRLLFFSFLNMCCYYLISIVYRPIHYT